DQASNQQDLDTLSFQCLTVRIANSGVGNDDVYLVDRHDHVGSSLAKFAGVGHHYDLFRGLAHGLTHLICLVEGGDPLFNIKTIGTDKEFVEGEVPKSLLGRLAMKGSGAFAIGAA